MLSLRVELIILYFNIMTALKSILIVQTQYDQSFSEVNYAISIIFDLFSNLPTIESTDDGSVKAISEILYCQCHIYELQV